MLSPYERFTGFNDKNYSLSDLTVIICIRLHDSNPWVLERLELLRKYYHHLPEFLIVDFGSEVSFSVLLEKNCKKNDYNYLYVPDQGTFSLSKARNEGYKKSSTELVYFTDIDFFLPRNGFYRLVELANTLQISKYKLEVVSMPAYHVNEKYTQQFFELGSFFDKGCFLERIGYFGAISQKGRLLEFIAPYSNNLLMHRDLYRLSGGYSQKFRGHGSEDFEFLIRLMKLSSKIPDSRNLYSDFYGPSKSSFYNLKTYDGFRRMAELFVFQSELSGLKAFHLWHPTKDDKTSWRKENDWKRKVFNEVVSSYRNNELGILNVDFLCGDKKILCLASDASHWRYFMPFRLLGYSLLPYAGDDDSYPDIKAGLLNNEYCAVMIFNPYMKSHAVFKNILGDADSANVKRIVIERGALPGAIYYADDVSYNDMDYSFGLLDEISLTESQYEIARDYIATIRQGGETLEKNESFPLTIEKYSKDVTKKRCFIPLQLPDDMAVNYFIKGSTSYNEFVKSIPSVASQNMDIDFLIKPHPLFSDDLDILLAENIYLCSNDENVHALIELSDFVVCYNSGVGLLSLIHEKPVFALGNAFYLLEGRLGSQCASFADAILCFKNGSYPKFDFSDTEKLIGWLIFSKYSFFSGKDIFKKFKNRAAHMYVNQIIEVFRYKGFEKVMLKPSKDFSFGWSSYAIAHLNIFNGDDVRNYFLKNKKSILKSFKLPKLFVRK